MKLSHLFKILFLTSSLSAHADVVTIESITSKLITQTPIAPHLFGSTTSSPEDIEPIVDWEKNKTRINDCKYLEMTF